MINTRELRETIADQVINSCQLIGRDDATIEEIQIIKNGFSEYLDALSVLLKSVDNAGLVFKKAGEQLIDNMEKSFDDANDKGTT